MRNDFAFDAVAENLWAATAVICVELAPSAGLDARAAVGRVSDRQQPSSSAGGSAGHAAASEEVRRAAAPPASSRWPAHFAIVVDGAVVEPKDIRVGGHWQLVRLLVGRQAASAQAWAQITDEFDVPGMGPRAGIT